MSNGKGGADGAEDENSRRSSRRRSSAARRAEEKQQHVEAAEPEVRRAWAQSREKPGGWPSPTCCALGPSRRSTLSRPSLRQPLGTPRASASHAAARLGLQNASPPFRSSRGFFRNCAIPSSRAVSLARTQLLGCAYLACRPLRPSWSGFLTPLRDIGPRPPPPAHRRRRSLTRRRTSTLCPLKSLRARHGAHRLSIVLRSR